MLPKIEYPLFDIYLHSLDKKVKCRPFLVKEEKILLIAKESKDEEAIRLSIRQVLTNCIQEPIDVDKLPMFDLEMLFVKMRAKSVGETVRLVFNCQNMDPNTQEPCNTDNDYTLDLDKVQYEIPEGHKDVIMITDKIGIKLKYPTLESAIDLDGDDIDSIISAVVNAIEYVFDGDSITRVEDLQDPKELSEYLEKLTSDSLIRIKAFFDTTPKVILEDKVQCKKCGFTHTLHTEGLIDFFI